MKRLLAFVSLVAIAVSQAGCVVGCGPGRCPPPQKVRLVTDSPASHKIRVSPTWRGNWWLRRGDSPASHSIRASPTHPPTRRDADEPIDTPVGGNGRVVFDVPIYTPFCRYYLFGVIRLNPDGRPEAKRRIRVMHGDKTIRKMSADDIARLPLDAEGFRTLKLKS